MKKLLLAVRAVFALIFVAAMAGCGTLNRDISLDHLTKGDMDYADGIKSGGTTLTIGAGQQQFVSDETANKLIIIPTFYSWESFGRTTYEYGYMSQVGLWPLIATARGSVYDSHGDVTARIHGGEFCPIFGYMIGEDLDNKQVVSGFSLIPIPIVGISLYGQVVATHGTEVISSRYQFLCIPIIGPCFAVRDGPSSGRPRFLWIPCGKEE